MDCEEGLNEEQSGKLREFRERLKDVLKPDHDDHYLLRWLRARQFDLNKSEDMLRKSLVWRKKYSVDTVAQDWEPPEVLQKYFVGGCCGMDKEGRPVWVTPLGNLDMAGISMSCRRKEIVKYNIHQIELVYKVFEKQSEMMGKRIDQVVIIDDMDGFTLKLLFAPGMDLILKTMAIVEANYPEALHQCYIINAPRIWSLVFNIVKPFLSADTKAKIKVLGSDWKEHILQVIDKDQLPKHWGGTQTGPDGDSYCSQKVCMGGEVPHSYYLSERTMVDEDKWVHTTVGAGADLVLEYHIHKPHCVINYLFKTEGHDIGFGVKSKRKEDSVHDLVTTKRVNSNLVPEMGVVECEEPGTYIFTFDNTYSWLNAKALSYFIEVVHADEVSSENRASDLSDKIDKELQI